MKMKDSRLIGSVYKVNSERIIGINVGYDMVCEISKLISGNRNKVVSIEATEIEDEFESINSRIVIHTTNQIFKLLIPDNKVNFWFDIPNNVKPTVVKQEEPVEQSMPEEIETINSPEVIDLDQIPLANSTPVEQVV